LSLYAHESNINVYIVVLTLIGVRDSYLLEELAVVSVVYIAQKYLGPFLDFSLGDVPPPPPPRIQRIKIEMILRYKYTVKKARKNLKLRVDQLQAMTGMI
jgi:hypothetical protein